MHVQCEPDLGKRLCPGPRPEDIYPRTLAYHPISALALRQINPRFGGADTVFGIEIRLDEDDPCARFQIDDYRQSFPIGILPLSPVEATRVNLRFGAEA